MELRVIIIGFVIVILCGIASIILNEMFAIGVMIGAVFVMWGCGIMLKSSCS
ncbi:hypothetical protein LCGC14_0374010 [marine sediment metagenome]|uniref:Uncharacterized protein n=1 Tax=marine sediment metagenome TaxID=412755 RepID=A0A0F9VRA8_9ZZZZ